MRTLCAAAVWGIVSLAVVTELAAQSSSLDVTLSTPALGSDMWTGAMGRQGAFVPRLQSADCSGSEVHIEVTPNGLGFCIEDDERSPKTWEEARHDCLQAGKRLPEPSEFKYACKNGIGLSNMTGNDEWVTNFPVHIYASDAHANFYLGLTMGTSSCTQVQAARVAIEPGTGGEESRAFRCVR